jgi:hypothetical protein
MKLTTKTAKCLTIFATAALTIAFSSRALACGKQLGQSGLAASELLSALLEAQTSSASAAALQGLSPSSDQRAAGSKHASIVGMWVVGFYHSGNQLWDAGIEQFSSDGNEVMNDNAFPPSEQNICWGTFVSVGNGQYKLKHIGWSYDTNGNYLGRADFAATITLTDHGDGYTAAYVLDQEDLSGNIIPAYHDEGTLKATRFKAD